MLFYYQVLFLAANVASIALAAWAFIEAENTGRIFIALSMGASFVVPKLWPGMLVGTVFFVLRICLGIGCYVYLRWRGHLRHV